MAKLANYSRDVATGNPFLTGSATLKDASGATITTVPVNGTTGRWVWTANGSPGRVEQSITQAGQTRVVAGDTCGQLDSGNFEAEIDDLLLLFSSGTIEGLAATAPGGMNVQIGVGTALNLGLIHKLYTAETKAIAASDPTNPRIDLIVSRLTRTGTFTGKLTLEVLTGTPAGSPVPPALTQDANTWEIELARVTVPAAAGSIVGGNISTTQRPISTGPVADGSVTQAKLAANSVDSSKIVDGSVALADLASGVIVPGLSPGLINTYWIGATEVVDGQIFKSSGALNLSQDTLYGSIVRIPKATTLTGLGVVRGGGNTGSATARLGLYAVGGDGLPNALTHDAGVVDVSTLGAKSVTGLSVPLAAGWYWGAVVVGAFSGSLSFWTLGPDVSADPNTRGLFGVPSLGANEDRLIAAQGAHTFGALPGTYPSPGLATSGPIVFAQTSGS